MKKITALLVSLIMSCAVMAGCSDSSFCQWKNKNL